MRRAAFTVLVAACASQPAAPARQMAQITDRGDHLAISTQFTDADSHPILLDGARVTATFRGQPYELPYADEAYGGQIPLVSPLVADEPVVLTLDSPAETVSSTITAPPPIALDPVPASVSRSQDLALTWSPASVDDLDWLIQSPCANGAGIAAPGADNVLVPAGAIDVPAGGTCAVDLLMMRTRFALPALPLQYGELRFTTLATASFSSTP